MFTTIKTKLAALGTALCEETVLTLDSTIGVDLEPASDQHESSVRVPNLLGLHGGDCGWSHSA